MATLTKTLQDDLLQLNLQMKNRSIEDTKYATFHGDELIGDKIKPMKGVWDDCKRLFTFKNAPALGTVAGKLFSGQGLDIKSAAGLMGSLSNDSALRESIIKAQVKSKYDQMLHPPLTYLGDAFQYRTADGKFNSALNPHLGQAGAPYAKTVPSKTHQLGALPDPGDLFDKLMARQEGGRASQSGLSSMLIYHATIIIHDIFRTNDNDKNISDSSSYLDLSPLYGYTMEMQRQIRDSKYKLGFLKPDTFAEDRLLRQPPCVNIYLIMYNRYHNYCAAQLRRINENGRFSVPAKYEHTQLEAVARNFCPQKDQDHQFRDDCKAYNKAWKAYQAAEPADASDKAAVEQFKDSSEATTLRKANEVLHKYIPQSVTDQDRKTFEDAHDAAWTKLDDDLFNTARLITCGQYIQISIHDYLRALMGFHQYNTNFTLDPRLDIDHHNVSRGLGNQVTVEFNMLYRFHCAISKKDEKYTEDYMRNVMNFPEPSNIAMPEFLSKMAMANQWAKANPTEPSKRTFGLPKDPKTGDDSLDFQRNRITGLFDDQKMINALNAAMDDPISNFGPRNIPKCMRNVEIMGIMQARKWEIGTLNDFRDFFGMERHKTFESVTKNVEIQNALRDLYEHPDKIELYPGVFCESDAHMGVDPGPSEVSSALWVAIFSDAITLVRSDRFYTVDWNTNSLTSWGMKEVTPDNDICKSSVFHRLLQRAFPGWYPYNSIRFFHPFYTAEQNAKFAQAQGYDAEFRLPVAMSNPEKPWKPVYLDDFEKISTVLSDESYDLVHPALKDPANFPTKVREVLTLPRKNDEVKSKAVVPSRTTEMPHDAEVLEQYFKNLMQSIVKREAITMNNTTYQIDATRDFAIPVVTRFVADFLGFGHLIRSEERPRAPHTENEIYQHITNCQTFLSYNADETKLLKRRKAFKTSMQFLCNLTVEGNIAEANKWAVTQHLFGRKRDNPMTELGFKIAQGLLEDQRDSGRAAAILLLVGLQQAYNSVLSFTSVLNQYFDELYAAANPSVSPSKEAPTWLKVQELAFSESPNDHNSLVSMIQKAERSSVKLPIIRTALKNRKFVTKSNDTWEIKKGETIILDIHATNSKTESTNKTDYLTYQSSFTDQYMDYHPKQLSVIALTGMIKFIATMRNPRRGHDAQGRLKSVKLDSSEEGFSNFMAPGRMQHIAAQAQKSTDPAEQAIYSNEVLRPATDTYLTPEWDEMIPFPTTWKIRFDGFGKSDYSQDGVPTGKLFQPRLPDDAPPFYQPQGASHIGGSFADVVCVCGTPGVQCACAKEDGGMRIPLAAEREPTLATGCGIAVK